MKRIELVANFFFKNTLRMNFSKHFITIICVKATGRMSFMFTNIGFVGISLKQTDLLRKDSKNATKKYVRYSIWSKLRRQHFVLTNGQHGSLTP